MSKEIPLTKGRFAIVDDDLFEELQQYRWHFTSGYACRSIKVNGEFKTISMHRHIAQAPIDLEVDHINGNGLDNRQCNLRPCTHQENQWNRRNHVRPNQYRGVTWHKKSKKWRARIRAHGKERALGYFSTREDAAKAYNMAASEVYGKFACLNSIGVIA